jgi:predicted exporter
VLVALGTTVAPGAFLALLFAAVLAPPDPALLDSAHPDPARPDTSRA